MKTKLTGDTYAKRCEEQVDEWVKGNAIHNHEDDECCPDFSCCKPNLMIEEKDRIIFKNASRDKRSSLCFEYLGALLGDIPGPDTYITDGNNRKLITKEQRQ